VLAGVRLNPEGGDLVVRGRTASGNWEQRLSVPPTPEASGSGAIVALFGREKVEDLELDLAAGAERTKIEPEIERAGLDHGIATRLTSWVAVSEQPDVDPRLPVRRERIPQTLPYGVSAEGLGLRAASAAASAAAFATSARRMMMLDAVEEAVLSEKFLPGAYHGSPPPFSHDRVLLPGEGLLPPIHARWVRLSDTGPQILELEIPFRISEWNPGEEAVVTLRDGSVRAVRIDPGLTTRPGSMVIHGKSLMHVFGKRQPGSIEAGSGLLVRLALVMPRAEAERAAMIEISGPGGRLRLQL
jgi:hypothetical protein